MFRKLALFLLLGLVLGTAFWGYLRPTFVVQWDAVAALCGF